jgi:hypothetical protein
MQYTLKQYDGLKDEKAQLTTRYEVRRRRASQPPTPTSRRASFRWLCADVRWWCGNRGAALFRSSSCQSLQSSYNLLHKQHTDLQNRNRSLDIQYSDRQRELSVARQQVEAHPHTA